MNMYIYNDYFVRMDKADNFCVRAEDEVTEIRVESAYVYEHFANYPKHFYEIAILMARIEMIRVERKKCNRGRNYPIIYQREFENSLKNFLVLYSIEQVIYAIEQMKYNEIEKCFMKGRLTVLKEYV